MKTTKQQDLEIIVKKYYFTAKEYIRHLISSCTLDKQLSDLYNAQLQILEEVLKETQQLSQNDINKIFNEAVDAVFLNVNISWDFALIQLLLIQLLLRIPRINQMEINRANKNNMEFTNKNNIYKDPINKTDYKQYLNYDNPKLPKDYYKAVTY